MKDALLDRFLHQAQTIAITGRSYRLTLTEFHYACYTRLVWQANQQGIFAASACQII
jgi:hypothetical protein